MGKKAYKVGSVSGVLAQSSSEAAYDPKLCDIFTSNAYKSKVKPVPTTTADLSADIKPFAKVLKGAHDKIFSSAKNPDAGSGIKVKSERFSNNDAASIRIKAKRKFTSESDETASISKNEDGDTNGNLDQPTKKKKKSAKKLNETDVPQVSENFKAETKLKTKKNTKSKGEKLMQETSVSVEEEGTVKTENEKKPSKKLKKEVSKVEKKLKKKKSKSSTASMENDYDKIITEFEKEQNNSDMDLDSDDDEANADAVAKDSEKSKKKNFELNKPKDKDPEKEGRTIFVGNLPPYVIKKKLKKLFDPFGTIETIRYRCAAPQKPYLLKKVAVNSKKLNPNQYNLVAYIRFKSIEEAEKAAAELNGYEMDQHAIVVDLAENKSRDNKKAIFVGNMPLKIQDDVLRKFFVECGKISSVRIIRNSLTGLGRGIGYVNFEDAEAVELALKKNGETLEGRPIRVSKAVKKEKKSKEQLIKEKAQKFGNQGSKKANPKSQGQRQGYNAARRIEKKTKDKSADEVKFTGDRLAEIGVLKRKSSKPDKGELKKARIASKLTGVSSTQFKKFNREKTVKKDTKKKFNKEKKEKDFKKKFSKEKGEKDFKKKFNKEKGEKDFKKKFNKEKGEKDFKKKFNKEKGEKDFKKKFNKEKGEKDTKKIFDKNKGEKKGAKKFSKQVIGKNPSL